MQESIGSSIVMMSRAGRVHMIDHRRQGRRFSRTPVTPRHQNEAASAWRDFLHHARKIQVRICLTSYGMPGTRMPPCRAADKRVRNRPTPGTPIAKSASCARRNSLTCRGVHDLLSQRLDSSGLSGAGIERHQVAVHADGCGTPTSATSPTRCAVHVRDGLFEVECRQIALCRLTHADPPGKRTGRIPPAAGVCAVTSRTTPPPRTRSRS